MKSYVYVIVLKLLNEILPAMAKAAKKASPAKKDVKAKKGSKAKDPNAPKRAMSAFFFWMADNRERIKKPGMGVAEVAKAAGVEWGKVADKSKWEKKAADDKKRYESEMAAYKGSE
uniref:HMG box domain-containing protein n=1 Tax=Angiostrongylus cantonensis TaxID=6313 RepID=A0A0K0DCA6_ANGCA